MHPTDKYFHLPNLRYNTDDSSAELEETWRERFEHEMLADDKSARAVCANSRWELLLATLATLGVRWMGASDGTCILCGVVLVGYVLLETLNVWGRRMQRIGVGNQWLTNEIYRRNVHAIATAGEAVVRRLERTV